MIYILIKQLPCVRIEYAYYLYLDNAKCTEAFDGSRKPRYLYLLYMSSSNSGSTISNNKSTAAVIA